MKIKHFLLSAIVLATSLASCVDDKEYVYDGGNGVKFNSTVAGQSPMARAANAAWQQGDAIGVYMKTGTGLDNIVDGAANKKHTTPGNGMFSPADPMTDAIFFPKSGAVDFIAYYPYSATLAANIYKVDVTNQTSQEKIDLLYSNDATGKSSGDNVVLGFKHELTKVVFNLIATEASADLTNVKVSIGNMPVKADFNLATGALTVDATMASIDMKSTVDPNTVLKAVAEGIVIPTAKAERKFTFTFKVGGAEIVKTWDAKDEPFDKGMKNSYNVQLVSDKGIIVSPSSNIQDWGPGSSEDIIIDLDGETTPGDGTQANPFTVEEAAAKVGENAKWVTGFIVGSTNTAKAVGTPSKDNIILATTKGETDESKWIIVDIKDSPVAKFLDIVASPDLVGAKVKVQGNIVNNIFGGVLAMTTITAQEGGKEGVTPPDPSGNLLFAGSNFNDWAAFLGGLNSFGLKAGYTGQSVAGGRDGSGALELKGTPAGNDYVFTALHKTAFTESPSKISFYIKGTAAKSLSLNVYVAEKDDKGNNKFLAFNLEDCTADKTLDVAPNNQYNGTINTAGQWVKVTLNVAGTSFSRVEGESIFALKVGKSSAYDLLVDDITFE